MFFVQWLWHDVLADHTFFVALQFKFPHAFLLVRWRCCALMPAVFRGNRSRSSDGSGAPLLHSVSRAQASKPLTVFCMPSRSSELSSSTHPSLRGTSASARPSDLLRSTSAKALPPTPSMLQRTNPILPKAMPVHLHRSTLPDPSLQSRCERVPSRSPPPSRRVALPRKGTLAAVDATTSSGAAPDPAMTLACIGNHSAPSVFAEDPADLQDLQRILELRRRIRVALISREAADMEEPVHAPLQESL